MLIAWIFNTTFYYYIVLVDILSIKGCELFSKRRLEFIYVLEGQVKYRHGFKLYHLEPGDTLYFDADAPHGPEELVGLPVKFLSVISYSKHGGAEKV